jgi:hypothetical protein
MMSTSAAARWLGCGILVMLILVPRLAFWGTVPAGVDGDEGGFAAIGTAVYAHRVPPLGLINTMPAVHLWPVGLARDWISHEGIWPARLVTSLFGLLQACAAVSLTKRLGGLVAAVAAAVVLAMPMEIGWERVMQPNVWTTATWTLALWCVVWAPGSRIAGACAGMWLAVGAYGYYSARFLPLIVVPVVAAGLLTYPRLTWRALWPGVVGFLLVVWPAALSFWSVPGSLWGHPRDTTWALGGVTWPALWEHISATARALCEGNFLLPLGVMPLAIVGIAASSSWVLAVALSAWMAVVAAALVARNQPPTYGSVMVCIVPAVAVAVGLSTRWLRWAVPAFLLVTISPPLRAYYRDAAVIPPNQVVPMAQGAFVQALPATLPLYIAGGPGCGHGVTLMSANAPCTNISALPTAPIDAVVILYPEFNVLAAACTEAGLDSRRAEWGATPTTICFPPAAAPVVTTALGAAAAIR